MANAASRSAVVLDRGTGRHHQPMTILDDHMPQITGLGLARRALLI